MTCKKLNDTSFSIVLIELSFLLSQTINIQKKQLNGKEIYCLFAVCSNI
jgi:hypothetical protein